MKVILEFNLPEEQEEFDIQKQANNMHYALINISNRIRSKLKYDNLSEKDYEIWTEISNMFWDSINEENLIL